MCRMVQSIQCGRVDKRYLRGRMKSIFCDHLLPCIISQCEHSLHVTITPSPTRKVMRAAALRGGKGRTGSRGNLRTAWSPRYTEGLVPPSLISSDCVHHSHRSTRCCKVTCQSERPPRVEQCCGCRRAGCAINVGGQLTSHEYLSSG
jgi:hypothetical protein